MSPRFSDAPSLCALPGLGPTTAAWLEAVGLGDEASLRAAGAVEAFRRLKEAFPHRVSWNALYGLHAALAGVHWNVFPETVRQQMREEVLAAGPPPGPGAAPRRRARRARE